MVRRAVSVPGRGEMGRQQAPSSHHCRLTTVDFTRACKCHASSPGPRSRLGPVVVAVVVGIVLTLQIDEVGKMYIRPNFTKKRISCKRNASTVRLF